MKRFTFKLEFRRKRRVPYLVSKIYTFGLKWKNSFYICSHDVTLAFIKFVYFVLSVDAVVCFMYYFATGPWFIDSIFYNCIMVSFYMS